MNDLSAAFSLAFHLIGSLDADLLEIIRLSLSVSLTAVACAVVLGFALGAFLAVHRFHGRAFVVGMFNAFMGLPPVVVGLVVYLFLSRSGPLGMLGLLYTPTAMIIAQVLLIFPIVTALSHQLINDLRHHYIDFFRSLGLKSVAIMSTLLWEGRFSLLTVALAGFGRATAEVGAVLLVGGNIKDSTRVMTTAIALETSKGNLALALALGIILVTLSLLISLAVQYLRHRRETFPP